MPDCDEAGVLSWIMILHFLCIHTDVSRGEQLGIDSLRFPRDVLKFDELAYFYNQTVYLAFKFGFLTACLQGT